MRFLAHDLWKESDAWISTNLTAGDGLRYGIVFPFDGWRTIALIATSGVILFTVCGNAMTLYAVCKMKTFQHSISNLYIASLAAADMIVGAFVMTFMMLYTIANYGKWTFGPIMCDIWQAVDFISCTVSLYSICAIGFDRWLNLEKPLRIFKRNRFTAKRALAFVWIAPVLIWIPLMIGFRLKNGPPADGTCSFTWHPTYVVPIIAVPLFYIPVFTLMILFVRISLVIRSHLVFLHQHSNQNTTSSFFDAVSAAASPASSRRRSAVNNTPLAGSCANLKLNGITTNGSNHNSPSFRVQKSKPPPLSPIISVNLTAIFNSNGPLTKGETGTSDSDHTNCANRRPNQSPLAMKVLRDRVSPQWDVQKVKKRDDDDRPIFDFDSPDSAEKSVKSKPADCKETTPLLCPNSGTANHLVKTPSSGSGSVRTNRGNSIAVSDNQHDQPDPQHRSISPVLFQIGLEDKNTRIQRSVSRESDDPPINLALNPTPSPVFRTARASMDQKRSSVTSDTAVVFTKRFLTHKPPLIRAKTELVLEMNRPKPKQSGRFSIIAMTSPLFSRKYSINIFSDMFPHCAGGIAQQIRAAKAVGVILMFFLISWAPFLIMWPLKTFCTECVSDRMYQLSIWANYLNSTLNPILYTLCSPRFQRVFRKHCARCPPAARTQRKMDQKRALILANASRRR